MRRVSSRQRLVSWDAFDASAPEVSSSSTYEEDEDDMSDYVTAYDPSPFSRRSSLVATPSSAASFGNHDSIDDEDDDGGMFALDLEEDCSSAARGRYQQHTLHASSSSVKPAAAGTKRDRSGAAAPSRSSSSSIVGMKKSVSFSALPTVAVTTTSPKIFRLPSAPVTPLPRPPSFIEGDGEEDRSRGISAAAVASNLPPFPVLSDPVPVEQEDVDEDDTERTASLSSSIPPTAIRPPPDEHGDDDYGRMPTLSAVAAVLSQPGEGEDDTPLVPPEDQEDDGDDYGKLPAVSSPSGLSTLMTVTATGQRRKSGGALRPEDGDDDDYGKMPGVSSVASILERASPLTSQPQQPSSQPPPLSLPRNNESALPVARGGGSGGTTGGGGGEDARSLSLPRNESEMSLLGLRYMTPRPSAADLGSLDSSGFGGGGVAQFSSLHRALQQHQTSLSTPQAHRPAALELSLTSLADDALLRVLSYLPPYDVRRFSASCVAARSATSGPAGRHLWTDMMQDRWPTLGRIADRAISVGGNVGGMGAVAFEDGSGIATAADAEKGVVAAGENDTNLSVLLGLSSLRSPSRVDPYFYAPTSHRMVEFRSFEFELSEGGRPSTGVDPNRQHGSGTGPSPDPREVKRQEGRRRAQRILADAGRVPVVQFTGRVGAGDRCIRSDAPLARPSAVSHATSEEGGSGEGGGGGCGRHQRSNSVDSAGSIGHRLSRWTPRSPLSSSPTASFMEFIRRSARGGICSGEQDEQGESTPVRPFVTPFVVPAESKKKFGAGSVAAGGRKKAVTVDLTPRLVAYFEVSILLRDESQEPPPAEGSTRDADGRPVRETAATARAAREWLRAGTQHPRGVPRTGRAGVQLPPHLRHPPRHGGRWHPPRRAVAGGAAAAAGGGAGAGAVPPPHQQIPTVHFHHPLMPLPLPIPPPLPHPQLLPPPRAAHHGAGGAGRHGPGPSDCIAVGLSTQSFMAHRRMPGWDRYSYGYHGDDGGIFHSSGEMERIFGPTYGPGDTVGCGADYLNGGIFFTLNGEFLGYAWTGLSAVRAIPSGSPAGEELYPTVGVDSTCPVACNFGEREFAFDLGAFVRESPHKDAVRQALGGLIRDRKSSTGAGTDMGVQVEESKFLRKIATV